MSSFTVNYRDGSKETVKVNVDSEHGKVSAQIGGIWWTMTANKSRVLSANRQAGHFVGYIVQTTAGTEVRFDHNGHVYAAGNPITAFARMVRGEGL